MRTRSDEVQEALELHSLDCVPKWAERLIDLLDMRLNEVRAELADRVNEQVKPETRLLINPYAEVPRRLNAKAPIRFRPTGENGDEFDIRLISDWEGKTYNGIEVHHYGRGWQRLVVIPNAANSVKLLAVNLRGQE